MSEMAKRSGDGGRQMDLSKSFKLAVRSLLTTCSTHEFSKAFPRFTTSEQQCLHQLFIQVITSLHGNVEDEFDALCLETQVGETLDTVEQLVEEQSLDPLFSEKTNIIDVVHDLSKAKKNEIQLLMVLLERAEEHNRLIRARLESLKKGSQNSSGTTNAAEKVELLLRSSISNYGTNGNKCP